MNKNVRLNKIDISLGIWFAVIVNFWWFQCPCKLCDSDLLWNKCLPWSNFITHFVCRISNIIEIDSYFASSRKRNIKTNWLVSIRRHCKYGRLLLSNINTVENAYTFIWNNIIRMWRESSHLTIESNEWDRCMRTEWESITTTIKQNALRKKHIRPITFFQYIPGVKSAWCLRDPTKRPASVSVRFF